MSHDLKIQDVGGHHIGFQQMSITTDRMELSAMRRWHMTKSQSRKLIYVPSSANVG